MKHFLKFVVVQILCISVLQQLTESLKRDFNYFFISWIHISLNKFPLFVVTTNWLWQPIEARDERQRVGPHIRKREGIPQPHFRKIHFLDNDIFTTAATSPYFTRMF